MWLLYQLLFYKLYRFAIRMRTPEGASFYASLVLGGLIWWWLIIFIELIDLRKYMPKDMIMILGICSVLINIIIFNKDRRYQKVAATFETNSYPAFYHVLAYILFFWTIAGPVILVRL